MNPGNPPSESVASPVADGKADLLLIPTSLELQYALADLPQAMDVQLCGWGPITAAVETSHLLARRSVRRLILLGIAGTYHPQVLPVGSAASFQSVVCYGIGAGEGDGYQSAAELGWLPNGSDGTLALTPMGRKQPLLLTVTSSAAHSRDVERRRQRHPQAMAEDMEAWGVAKAASRFGVPLTVIRGISNKAGDRNREHWQISTAIRAAVALLLQEKLPSA